MKIAIHHAPGSFSTRWIDYCESAGIPFKIVDCYSSDIIRELEDCDALYWHFYHASLKDSLFAKSLLNAVAASGKFVFPDFPSYWHFDDKVAQKYLLEAVGAPVVPSYVFFSKEDAVEWLRTAPLPLVFKLRGGAGSQNVRLVETRSNAMRLVDTAFGRGFKQYSAIGVLKDRYRKFREGRDSLLGVLKALIRVVISTPYARARGREKGYVYFQEFIPNNDSDIRVIVIDRKAFAIKRLVRKSDFRASGSGKLLYDRELFREDIIKLAFSLSARLKARCVAFDFVLQNNCPLVVEISYGFSPEAYDQCPGYWDADMNWHQGVFNPQAWMIDLALTKARMRRAERE